MACVSGHIIRLDVVRAEIRRIEAVSAILAQVCSVDTGAYLIVSPSEPVWITDDMPAIFQVKSNTNWVVE
ncbi:MAG: hypothetical protein LUD46_20465 [Parabacteroides sp.]|nr:hypothetical protein [Parabacteroides sp.]